MQNPCIFCAIANKLAPAEILYEDDAYLAFRDIHPMAPVHILIIPKKHIDSVNEAQAEDAELLGNLILTAQKVARDQNLAEKGFRLMINTGKDGGQTVPHIHIHFLGGKPHLPVQVG